MDFLVLDVETANSDYSSICQIGLVKVIDGSIQNEWSSLINPESFFDPFNVSIHGIDNKKVKDKPTFDQVYHMLLSMLEGRTVIHHGHFDRVAINRVCNEYGLLNIDANWLDSTKIVRRTWEQFAHRGYGLKNISNYLGIEFNHHDALEDSRATYYIVKEACKKTGLNIDDWKIRINQPIKAPEVNINRKIEGNPDGTLYGEVVVFTGELKLSRAEASKIASDKGCTIGTSVTKKTTKIVVGLQDDARLKGYQKSTKHRKAEELIRKGSEIEILSEKDFYNLCEIEDIEPLGRDKKEIKNDNDKSVSFSLDIGFEFYKYYDDSKFQNDVSLKKDIDLNISERRGIAQLIEEVIEKMKIENISGDKNYSKYDFINDIENEFNEIKASLNDFRKGKINFNELGDDIEIYSDSIFDYLEKFPKELNLETKIIKKSIIQISEILKKQLY